VPEKGASEVRPHADWPAGRASEVEFRARDRRRRRPIDDESWLARKIINFFNFEKWYPDLLGFGSTKGEAAICDPNNENCYPVESPTPNVPGRLYGKTDPDTGVQLPGRVGGGRIQEHKLNQIIQEEYIKLLNEQQIFDPWDKLPAGRLPTSKEWEEYDKNRFEAKRAAEAATVVDYTKRYPGFSPEEIKKRINTDRDVLFQLEQDFNEHHRTSEGSKFGKIENFPSKFIQSTHDKYLKRLEGRTVGPNDPTASMVDRLADELDKRKTSLGRSPIKDDKAAVAALAAADRALEQFGHEYDFELTSGMVPSIPGKEISLKPAGPVSLGIDVGYKLPPHVHVYQNALGKWTGLYNEKTDKFFPFPVQNTYASLPTHGMQFYNSKTRQNVYVSNADVAASFR